MSEPNFGKKNVEVDLRPYGAINAGEEKLEKISDTGRVAKCIFFIFTEQNLQTKKHIRDILQPNCTPRNISVTFCNSDAGAKVTLRQVAEDYIATHQPATDDGCIDMLHV